MTNKYMNQEKILKLLKSSNDNDIKLAFEIIVAKMSAVEIKKFLGRNKCRKSIKLIGTPSNYLVNNIKIIYYHNYNADIYEIQ